MDQDKEKKPLPEEENGEEENDIIELTDEDGVTSKFEYLTTIEHEKKLYVVLMLLDEEEKEDEDEGEVLILEIQKDDKGEDVYVSVDDEEVSQAVFDQFMAMMDEEEAEGDDHGEDEEK